MARVGTRSSTCKPLPFGNTVASGESAAIDWPRFTATLVTTPAIGARISVSLFASEPTEALELVARRRDSRLLELHLTIDLDELALEVLRAPAQLLDLLQAEVAPLRLLLLEDAAAGLHFLRDGLARRCARADAAVERDLRHRVARFHLVAFLDEELGHAAGVGEEDACGARIEREVALDALAPRVLAP